MVKEAGVLYAIECPICGRKIYGTSKKRVARGLKQHIEWRHRVAVIVEEEEV